MGLTENLRNLCTLCPLYRPDRPIQLQSVECSNVGSSMQIGRADVSIFGHKKVLFLSQNLHFLLTPLRGKLLRNFVLRYGLRLNNTTIKMSSYRLYSDHHNIIM
jgi:hypothetical protein